jgi:uncharacterized repeat protein (TIGR01451 family)
MRKVGSLTGMEGATRATRAVSLRVVLAGTLAAAVGLVIAAVSGAAGPTASVSVFDQCSNGAPPSTATDCPGGWINGILQQNNSHYAEDEVTPQRVVVDLAKGSPLTGRSIEVSYLTRKGGVHAYDSLATWNHTQTSADRCAGLAAANCVGGAASTIAIPSDPTVVADSGGGGSATSGHQLGGQVFTLYGGTLTGVSGYTHDDPAGTGDEYANVTISYSVPSTTDGAKVMLLFGGHIAPGLGPRGWGPGLGAGSISGGPYHIKLVDLDDGAGNVGSQDNQIMSSAILAPANIVIKKTAVGGDGTFDYTATGLSSPFSVATSGGTGQQNFTNLAAGSYTVTESTLPAGWDFSNLVCVDPTTNSSVDLNARKATINLSAGETVTCTFTNTKRGQIVVEKQTNPDGDPQLFTFAPSYGSNFQLSDGQTNTSAFLTPGTYSVSETVPGGWDQTGATCDDGSSPGSIGLSAGETVKCTFTNTKRGALVVIKHVVKDNGGTATASAWSMHVKQGGSDISGSPFAGAESPGTSNVVTPGTYNVSESGGPSGYALTYSGDCDSSGNVTVPAGQTKTCTLTNDDIAPQLTVIKHVVKDNGGTAVASDWTMQIKQGASVVHSFAGAESPGTTRSVTVGSYKVVETGGPSGYVLAYSGDCDSSGNVTVALGEQKTCTLTNDDQAATLIVKKIVVNDNGGSKSASDFSFQVNGGTAQSFEGDGQNDLSVAAGTYTVTEPAVAGYATSYDNCSNVVIPSGGTATCTITNNDQAATLIVKKVVVNDNGGTKAASDFSFQVNGGSAQSFEADGQNELAVSAGTYSVTEPAVAGYATSYDNCSNVVVPNGGSATCTITNDDQAGRLIVKKVVVNDDGGTATADDFSFAVNGGAAQAFEADGQNELTVNSWTYYFTEPAHDEYATSYDNCSNVVVPNGGSATCTITNDDRPATLIVKKVVVNDNGGTKLASEFSFQVNGGAAQSFEADAQNDLTVDAGTYGVTEPGVEGYATSYDNCSELVIPNGGSETCTITNDDRSATLIVKKVVVNDNGGTKVASDFSFQVNGGQAQAFEADGQNDLTVNAGTYEVLEPAVAGYTTTYQGCENIVLPIGGSATCTVTNNDVPRGQGSISVSKSANPTTLKEPGGQVTFSVTITNTSADVDVAITNVVDDKFGDLDDDGGNGCFDVPVNLKPGGKVNCTFQKNITGQGGTSHVNVVTATGVDEGGHELKASDDARVDITERLIDLVVVKEASSPTPLNGIVNYTLTVTNKGPETATNVQLADPAPAGIEYLSAAPSQGTCALTPAIITCSLGSLAPNQTVTIAIRGRATTVGQHTNTATVTGSGGRETNPADNVDSAVTVVPAPLKPPTTKPEPKPEVCLALTVSPKMIKADGKPDKVKVVVTAGKKRVKGIKVVVKGAGVSKTGRTNGKGVAQITINPKRAGLITVSVAETNQKLCGPQRIGVVGVFLPPLTG